MLTKTSLLALLVPTLLTASAEVRRPHPSPKHDIASFHYMFPISKTDFRNIGDVSLLKTFTQTTPASCTFVDNVGYQGNSSSTIIGENCSFFVQSDNVIIDLGGKTLYQNSANTSTNGIEINTGQKNITIKNGSIVGFKGAGILVHSGCDNIRIQDVTISSCGRQGVYLKGTNIDGTEVTNCIIENTIISRTTGIATLANATALQLDYCQNIFVQNSVFCHSDGRAATKDGIGVLVQNGIDIVFDNCDASTNKGQNAYGFQITGTDTGTSACGFTNCTAQNNVGSNSATGTGYGFYSNIVSSCLWQNCIAAGNSGIKNGYGFYDSASSYATHIGCESNYNKAGALATLAIDGGRGFYATGGLGNSYIECIAVGNQGNAANSANMSAGFDLQTENYGVINGCEARANGTDASSAWGVGINLAGSSQVIIKKSRIFNNRSNTATQGCGIKDAATSSTTLIIDCFLFGNGQGTTSNNFSVTYPGQGEINLTAPVSAGGMGGISLIKPFQNVTVTAS